MGIRAGPTQPGCGLWLLAGDTVSALAWGYGEGCCAARTAVVPPRVDIERSACTWHPGAATCESALHRHGLGSIRGRTLRESILLAAPGRHPCLVSAFCGDSGSAGKCGDQVAHRTSGRLASPRLLVQHGTEAGSKVGAHLEEGSTLAPLPIHCATFLSSVAEHSRGSQQSTPCANSSVGCSFWGPGGLSLPV